MTSEQENTINLTGAIALNRAALQRIVEMLFVLVGLDEAAVIATLPRCTRNYVMRILRPAESAARRLIVIAARGIEVVVRPASPAAAPARGRSGAEGPASEEPYGDELKGGTNRSFPLVDPRKRFDFAPRRHYATTAPRVRSLHGTALPVYMRVPEPPARHEPAPADPLDATRLCRRLRALKAALDDIPGQAKRLARREARRGIEQKRPGDGPVRLSPMRPGWPPGYRKRPFHEIDGILRECHSLALYARELDTS